MSMRRANLSRFALHKTTNNSHSFFIEMKISFFFFCFFLLFFFVVVLFCLHDIP